MHDFPNINMSLIFACRFLFSASEPNLLKMRLKQRVLERRSSPLVRRKDRAYVRRRSNLAS